jgi:hypothetical protein
MSDSAGDSTSEKQTPNDPVTATESDLDKLIREIGVARFASRISAGLIDDNAGYKAIERFVKADVHRPFLSRLGQALLDRPDSYDSL